MLIDSVAATLKDSFRGLATVTTPSDAIVAVKIKDSDHEVRVILARAEYGNRRVFRIQALAEGRAFDRKSTQSFSGDNDAESVRQGQRAIMLASEFIAHALAKAHLHLQEA